MSLISKAFAPDSILATDRWLALHSTAAQQMQPLRNHSDVCYWVDLHPLGVVLVLHVGSNDAHMGPDGWNLDRSMVAQWTRRHSIRLSHGKLADDFEYQVPALCVIVSGIQQLRELILVL